MPPVNGKGNVNRPYKEKTMTQRLMARAMMTVAAATLAAGMIAGCSDDRPARYGHERPSVSDLSDDDHGLQSKDVVDASDQVVQYLLQLPDFNGPRRQTVVFTKMENKTTNPMFNYDIFLQRLKANVGQYGRDRIMLIENRDRIQRQRSEEIEGTPDAFGQGDGSAATPRSSVQPEWNLYGVVSELPNQGNRYYLFEFNLSNNLTREVIPLRPFEVKVNN